MISRISISHILNNKIFLTRFCPYILYIETDVNVTVVNFKFASTQNYFDADIFI